MNKEFLGVWNKFLSIDLTTKTVEHFQVPPEYYPLYLGGKAMGARLLNDFQLYHVDPLSPENVIMFLVGPASGTLFPGAAKALVFTRSPLTGIYLDSATGGGLSNAIKRAGYDGIILHGRASQPSYLVIKNESVEILPAGDLWGLNTFETEKRIRQAHGLESKGSVFSIGPGGENQVPFACITGDFYHQAGRGGAGAVLGSKNLKGMAVFGSLRVPVADQQTFQKDAIEYMRLARQSERVTFRARFGTLTTLDMTQRLGIVPVKNFQDGFYEGYEVVNAENIRKDYVISDLTCLGCPMPCGKHVRYDWKGEIHEVGGPEYETLALLGANLGINHLEGIAHLNYLCDDLGIDTITTGNVLACATEAYQKGLLTRADTGGMELAWGDVDTFDTLVHQIAQKEGFGAELALGVKGFSEKYGFEDLAMHVKGLEIPGYDPRGTTGYALEYSVADRGGCHRRARPLGKEEQSERYRFGYDDKASYVVSLENLRAYNHSLTLCDYVPTFFGMRPEDHAKLLKSLTGWDFTPDDLMQVGARAINLARLFNNRCGIRRENDQLPKRFFKEAMQHGASAEITLDSAGVDRMIREYYATRGWDQDGQVTEETIAALQLA